MRVLNLIISRKSVINKLAAVHINMTHIKYLPKHQFGASIFAIKGLTTLANEK